MSLNYVERVKCARILIESGSGSPDFGEGAREFVLYQNARKGMAMNRDPLEMYSNDAFGFCWYSTGRKDS